MIEKGNSKELSLDLRSSGVPASTKSILSIVLAIEISPNQLCSTCYLGKWGNLDIIKNDKRYLEDIGLDLRLPERFTWREEAENGDTILHYSTMDEFENCTNKKTKSTEQL